jgi:hypothetical protein
MGVNSRVFTFLDRIFPKWKPAPGTVETKKMDQELWEQTLISPPAAKLQAAVRTTVLMNRFIRKTRRPELQTHSPYGEKEEKGGPWCASFHIFLCSQETNHSAPALCEARSHEASSALEKSREQHVQPLLLQTKSQTA